MGAIGLNGATIEVDDHTQRIRVANAGWFRWAPIASLSLASHVMAALALGKLTAPGRQPVVLGKTRLLVTAFAVVATASTGVAGGRIVSEGDVPVATAVTPIQATPSEIATMQKNLRILQWAIPALTGAISGIDVLQRELGGP